MFVLCCKKKKKVCGHEKDEKGLIQNKKNPTGGMDVCVVFVVRTIIWNVK
jgi:hypothetical protein